MSQQVVNGPHDLARAAATNGRPEGQTRHKLGPNVAFVAGCAQLGDVPAVDCGPFAAAACERLLTLATDSLSPDAKATVGSAAIRPSSVLTCGAALGCRPLADVDLWFFTTGKSLVVTVSRTPDGRLLVESY